MKKLINVIALTVLALAVNVSAQSIKSVPTLASLKLLQPDPNYPYALAWGQTAAGDGGGGLYKFTEDSSIATNYAIITSTIDSTGQWIRVPLGSKSPQTQAFTATGPALKAEASSIRVAGTGGAIVITNQPSISTNGVADGQVITVVGTSDSNTLQLVDEGTMSGSKIQLLGTSTNIVLGIHDTLVLRYDATLGYWTEVSRSNN